jgi:ubiquinone/menaquinone biosynthesis C-methylase UbiE
MSLVSGMHHLAAAAFDRVASSYDELFTQTAIGRAQRKQVWARLLAAFPTNSYILELNCGTGEDARFLASHGHSVLACDASSAMIQVAQHRHHGSEASNVQYRVLANEHLHALQPDQPFDGAFSNFSGLNCVADLTSVARNLATLIKPGGRALLCFWSRACLVEVLWYLLHGEFKKAVRRFSRQSTARLGGLTMPVYYPSICEIRAAFAPWFQLESGRAIGFFVPPSYFEPWIAKHPKILAGLGRLDQTLAHWPVLRDAGDHVLLEFVRCHP